MNKFEEYFFNRPKRLGVYKWHHYLNIYERHFNSFRDRTPNILEIGVYKGGSLEMWNYYFGGGCNIFGIDIDPNCKDFESLFDNVRIFTGDQGDRNFWQEVKSILPKIDIVIDDGGHSSHQQIITFEELYPHMSENGVYLCEDTHTSYWEEFGGGVKNPDSFIEYTKTFIDKLHSHHIREDIHKDMEFRHTTNSIHYYDSIVVIEKLLDRTSPVATIQGPIS